MEADKNVKKNKKKDKKHDLKLTDPTLAAGLLKNEVKFAPLNVFAALSDLTKQ